MSEIIQQLGISAFGLSAIFLVNTRGRWRRYGSVCGMLSQPFWFWMVIEQRAWGLFVLSVVYTGLWLKGLHADFIKKG